MFRVPKVAKIRVPLWEPSPPPPFHGRTPPSSPVWAGESGPPIRRRGPGHVWAGPSRCLAHISMKRWWDKPNPQRAERFTGCTAAWSWLPRTIIRSNVVQSKGTLAGARVPLWVLGGSVGGTRSPFRRGRRARRPASPACLPSPRRSTPRWSTAARRWTRRSAGSSG